MTRRDYTLSTVTAKMAKSRNIDLTKAKKRFREQAGKLIQTPRWDANKVIIEFRLTFDEWLRIWLRSGKYHLRGNRIGEYCMSRPKDCGHYEVGNVRIILHSANSSQTNRHPGTPLKAAELKAIRESKASQFDLALKFNRSPKTMQLIRDGRYRQEHTLH